MAIRAYDELYLPGAQNILGHAVDFAVMTLAIEPNAPLCCWNEWLRICQRSSG